MKKNLLLAIATMLLPMNMMAQTLVFDQESGLEYLDDDDDGGLYIDVGSGNITTINGTPSNQYFVTDGGLRQNWRTNIPDSRLNGQAKWYKKYLDEIKTLDKANNGPTTFKGIEYFRNLESLTIPMIGNNNAALSLDLSKNTKLSSLTWNVGTWTKKLTYINVSNTQLTTLSLPNGANANLKTIVAENSKLTTLDISSLSVLETVNLTNSADLTTLTVGTSTNTTLKTIDVSGTGITSLDLTAYTGLIKVVFDNTKMTFEDNNSGTLKVSDPSTWIKKVTGTTTMLLFPAAVEELVIDVTKGESTDVSSFPNLKKLTLIGATDLTLPNGLTTFTLVATESPNLGSVDFSAKNNLKNLTLIDVANAIMPNMPPATFTINATKTDPNRAPNLTIDLSDRTFLTKLVCKGDNILSLNVSGCTGLTSELDVSECTQLDGLNAENCTNLPKIRASSDDGKKSAMLRSSEIKLAGCSSLTHFFAHRNRLTDLEFLNEALPSLTQLQVNGGAPSGERINERTNAIDFIDHTILPETLTKFLIRRNLIEILDLSKHGQIKELQIDRNRLWALNLEHLQEFESFSVEGQETYAQAKVVDGELRVFLPGGEENAQFKPDKIDKEDEITILGKKYSANDVVNETSRYIKIPSTAYNGNGDIDLSDKKINYKYNTGAGGFAVKDPNMDVTINLDPYILYMHPATDTGVGYCSGTLYLDYHAVVPKGVRVYIATSVKNEGENSTPTGDEHHFDLLVLKLIGEENDIIPAETPMYVKSESVAGLYDFQRAGKPNYVGWIGLHQEEKLEIDKNNPRTYTSDELKKIEDKQKEIKGILESSNLSEHLLTGTLSSISTPGKVLTLGKEYSTKQIGFWPFKGPSIAAHRCYITADAYNKALSEGGTAAGETKGALFFFDEGEKEDDVIVTEIQTVEQKAVKPVREGWYTLQGVRLNGRPTQQGIYIHNGKKVKK